MARWEEDRKWTTDCFALQDERSKRTSNLAAVPNDPLLGFPVAGNLGCLICPSGRQVGLSTNHHEDLRQGHHSERK